MDSLFTSIVVTGVFIILTGAAGSLLQKAGKPYGMAKVAIHGVLFLLVAAGLMASFIKLGEFSADTIYSKLTTSLNIASVALALNFLGGIVLVKSKDVNKLLVIVHKLSTLCLVGSVIACIVFIKQA